MPKLTKADLAKLTNLDDATRADLSARFDEITELETNLAKIRAEKADADQIVARAGEADKASKAKDTKILELEGLLAKHTGKAPDEISLTMFAPFFGEDTW
jgi:hypothetical protein